MTKIVFSERVKKFPKERLKQWFRENKRSFPWRENPTPYRVWVSEVMLQQTRAEVVVNYFIEWMQKFPTLESLAAASEDEVIKLWEGLGNYTRARNLLYGARMVMQEFSGQIPDNHLDLLLINGLGTYTVHAILAFAFKKKVAAVDGNVLRVISRVFLIESSIDLESTKTWISRIAQSLLPSRDPEVFSEALIELGACVCTRSPKCEICPIRGVCGAAKEGKQACLPVRHARKKTVMLYRWVAIILYEGAIVLEQRKPQEMMAGLYEFPYIEVESNEMLSDTATLVHSMESHLGTQLVFFCDIAEQHHAFTYHRVRLVPKVFHAVSLPKSALLYSLDTIDALPFSSGHRKIKTWLLENAHTLIHGTRG